MSKYLSLDIRKIHDLLVKQEISPVDLAMEALANVPKKNGNFIEVPVMINE